MFIDFGFRSASGGAAAPAAMRAVGADVAADCARRGSEAAGHHSVYDGSHHNGVRVICRSIILFITTYQFIIKSYVRPHTDIYIQLVRDDERSRDAIKVSASPPLLSE